MSDFIEFFSRCQDELVTPDEYERYVEGLAANYEKQKKSLDEEERLELEEIVAQQKEVARVYRTSDALVRGRNLVTFGMQMLESVHLLKQDAALRRELQARYRHILVDEFQDLNPVQYRIIRALARELARAADRELHAAGRTRGSERAADRGVSAGHAARGRHLAVALEGALDLELGPQAEEQRDDRADEEDVREDAREHHRPGQQPRAGKGRRPAPATEPRLVDCRALRAHRGG